jgi:hypothetical protein
VIFKFSLLRRAATENIAISGLDPLEEWIAGPALLPTRRLPKLPLGILPRWALARACRRKENADCVFLLFPSLTGRSGIFLAPYVRVMSPLNCVAAAERWVPEERLAHVYWWVGECRLVRGPVNQRTPTPTRSRYDSTAA